MRNKTICQGVLAMSSLMLASFALAKDGPMVAVTQHGVGIYDCLKVMNEI